jgi:2'-5' RNA ligase
MPKYSVDDLVVSVDDLVPPDLNEQASQAAGIPLKGIAAPKVKMEETPGATGMNLISESIIRPARSIQQGYNRAVAKTAKLGGNLAQMGADMAGNPYMSKPAVAPDLPVPSSVPASPGKGWRDEIAADASRAANLGLRGATTYHVAGTENANPYTPVEEFYQGEANKLEGQGATGLAKPLYEAIGQAPVDLAKYGVATAVLGGPLGMAAVDAASEADKGFGHAALAGAKGAALGSLGHVMAPARTATRMAGMGTAMGAETAIGGGSPTDTAAAFLTGAGLAAPGANGTSFKGARLGEQRANIELEQLRREHAAQAKRPGDYFGTRETAPNEQPVEIMPPSVPKTEQPVAQPTKSRKEQLLERYGDRTKAAQDAAYQQGYADVHPEDSTRLPWEYSWQARPDTALPATPFKSAAESAAVFEAPRSAQDAAQTFIDNETRQPPAVEAPAPPAPAKPLFEPATPLKSAKVFTVDDLEVPNDRESGQQVPAGIRQGQEPGNVPVAEPSAAPGEAGPVFQKQGAVPEGPSRQEIPPSGREGLQPVGVPGSAQIHVDDLMPALKSEPPREEVIQPKAAPAGAEQAAPAHEFASTQANLSGPVADKVKQESLRIPDFVLAEDGRESQPHVTVKYGLHDDSPAAIEKIREVLSREHPVRARLGETSIFPAKNASGSDVVKVDVESPDLHRINKAIADALPHTDTHPTYRPHVTLAYVKPGEGTKFAGNKALDGQEITLDHISFSKRDGSQVDIPLGGAQAAPAQQRVVADPKEIRVPIEDLHVDPQRFQYKMDAYLKGGVTDEYKGVTKFDRDKAGTIAVWRDPADGKTYVVNGHHRYEMAARLGEDSMSVRYVDAPNAAQARLKGALINIGDGKGTAVDAAKVFRDSGLTPEELAANGISMKGKVAEDGLALSKLTGVLFDDVVRGGLTHRQGAIIGKGNLSEAAQIAVAKFMAGHPNMREGALEEVVRRAGKAGSKQVEQESLFGTNAYEESLFNEEAHLVADIKARLGQEKRLFSVVGNENAASRLAGAGNKIEAERNAQIAGEAGEALGVFDALQDKSGPIADAIAQAAREVADGKPRKQVADQLYGIVRAEVSKAVRGGEGGVPAEPGGGVASGPSEGPGLFDAPSGVSPRRLADQGGFLTIPGKQPAPPMDAAEQARATLAAKREAARKGKEYSLLEKLTKRKAEFVDNLSPILDVLAKNNDSSRRDFSNAADRSLGSRELAEREIRDGGLMRAIQAADDYQALNDFLVAKEAIRESQGKDRATGVDLAGAKAIYNKYVNMPANESGITYGQLAKEVGLAGDRLLDYSVKSGLVSQQIAGVWRQQYGTEHVPLSRIMGAIEDASANMSGTKATASLSAQSVYQKRVGSERAIENPLETMLDRTRKAFEQGEKNKAAALLASYANKPGMQGLLQEVSEADSKTSFTYLRDGKKVVIQTTPEIAAAAKCLNAQQMNKTLALIMNGPARLARMGTTGANIAFGFANPVGDWFTTLVNSKEYRDTSLNPKVFGQAFAAAYFHNQTWSRIEKTGAGFTSLDLFRETMPQTVGGMRKFRSAKDYAKHLVDAEGFKGNKVKWAVGIPVKRAAGLIRAIEDFNNRGEQFGRARLFLGTERANLRRGATPAEAEAAGVHAANNELPNYRRHGDVTNGLGGAILYLNARVQGARSFVSAFQDRPVQTATKIMVGVYAPMAMLTVANMYDEKRRAIYRDIPEYEKEGYMIYIAPGAVKNEKTGRYDGVFKMKMAPDIGAIATPVRRAIEAQMGGEKVNPLQDVARPIAGSVLPFDPSPRGMWAGLLPQAAKPSTEYATNFDTFRQKPIVNQRLQDLPVEEQVAPNTSGTMKKLAGALNAPPIKVEQFVKSTLGGWTPQLLNLADTAAAAAGAIKPEEIGGETLPTAVLKRFTSAAGGAQENSYYTLRREAQEKAARAAIKRIRANPAFDAFDEQQKKRAINSAANQARQSVIKAEGGKSIRTATPERKVEIMKEFLRRLPE